MIQTIGKLQKNRINYLVRPLEKNVSLRLEVKEEIKMEKEKWA